MAKNDEKNLMNKTVAGKMEKDKNQQESCKEEKRKEGIKEKRKRNNARNYDKGKYRKTTGQKKV